MPGLDPATRRLLAAAWGALLGLPAAAQVGNCDELRQRIEDKIRASGVRQFAVTVVDAAASAGGRVVGSCDKGSRRIVYSAPPGAAASAAAPAVAARPVLTECRDGRVLTEGHCGKR